MSQKVDLIAELKASKDITGIKKMKVERAKLEDRHSSSVYGEATRQFTPNNFVDTVSITSTTLIVNAQIFLSCTKKSL